MARRRIEPKVGDVFEIALGDGKLAFGHILKWNLVGFYAIESEKRLALEEIIRGQVAFRVTSMKDAIRDGKWPILGNTAPPPAMNEPIRFWRSTAPGFVFISEWRPGPCEEDKRVTEVEVVGLERSVIWSSFHVVERLKYFFRGEPYPEVEIG